MNGLIPASEWNAVVRELWRKLNVQVQITESGAWRHPWQITPRYDGAAWVASIQPGFVNGREAYITVPRAKAPAGTIARLRQSKTQPQASSTVDAWLTEFPALPLSGWRAIGPDAQPTNAVTEPDGSVSLAFEQVPEFFLNLGVAQSPKGNVNADTGVTIQPTDGRTRLLRALDVVLTQPRMATTSDFESSDVSNSTVLKYTVYTKNAAAIRKRAQIDTTPKYEPPNPQDPLQQLLGIWADDGLTHLHLATVWMVSPPGAEFLSSPDASWKAYLEHRVFWNLDFNTNQLPEALKDQKLSVNTGLAAGVGDRLNEYLLSQVNDANSAIAQFLGRSTIEGRFWTV